MAVADFFLKIDGIEGESQDAKHKNEIHINNWHWGATNEGSADTGGGLGAGKVQMHDFSFQMDLQKASPKLFLACSSGQHIKSAILTCRKAGGDQQEFLKVTFSDLLISSHKTHGEGDERVLPLEDITFNFVKIEHEYKEQQADGSLGGAIKTGWDVKLNKKV